MGATTNEIGLVDFIDSFRQELFAAMQRSEKERLQFQVSKIDLELQVTAEQSGGPNGKVEFKVLGSGVSLGASGKLSKKRVHAVKLSLTPLLDGKPFNPQIHSGATEYK
jgi:hypothetical protein